MSNPIEFKIQNPTHLTSHGDSMHILITVSWMLLGFYWTMMRKKSPTSFLEEHKHTKVV